MGARFTGRAAGAPTVRIVDIRVTTVPIEAPLANAAVAFTEMTVSPVAVVTDARVDGRQVVGLGFTPPGRYGQESLLRERLIPRILAASPEDLVDVDGNLDPELVRRVMLANEKPGGHGDRAVAAAAVEMAVWDAVAKIEGVPLYAALSRRYRAGEVPHRVDVYAAGGYYAPERTLASLKQELRGYFEAGFTVVKMKVGGGLEHDRARIEAALGVTGDGSRLAVDANAALGPNEAVAYAHALEPYQLRWFEEPCDPLDFETYGELARRYGEPLATGENLLSTREARNLLLYAGLRPDKDLLQMDPGLAYGATEYVVMANTLEDLGWPRRSLLPHGGHLFALHVVAGLGLGACEAYPDVFRPFCGFTDDTVIEDGQATLSDVPGLGIEAKSDLWRSLNATLLATT